MFEGCVFCDQSWMRAAEIFIETPHCIFVSSRDPAISELDTVRAEHIRPMSTVTFAADGKWLASSGEDGTVRIWDPATGRERAGRAIHDDAVRAMR